MLHNAAVSLDAARILDAIDSVDWSAIPVPLPDFRDDPLRAARALRSLALSTTLNETGDAASVLASTLICDHAGLVYPAAHPATPILLDLVEHGARPRIRAAALGLLDDALHCLPSAGHQRVSTSYGDDVPICCAIARHIRGRRAALVAHGRWGARLVADADLHWRLTVEDAEPPQPDGASVLLGVLEGAPFPTPVDAEMEDRAQPDTPAAAVTTVRIESLVAEASGAAYVRISGASERAVRTGSVLRPAECGLREH